MEEETQDIRWIQRLENYRKALSKLTGAVKLLEEEDLSADIRELAKEGLVQRFEYTQELAWKVIKDYAEYQGYRDIRGSRDAFRRGLAMGIIENPVWLESIEDRNLTSHTYHENTALQVCEDIIKKYYPLFVKLEEKMTSLTDE